MAIGLMPRSDKFGVTSAIRKLLVLCGNTGKDASLSCASHVIIIYLGKRIPFSPEERSINLGAMFGYLKEENGHVAIANRIFEMVLLSMFMAKEAITSEVYEKGGSDRIGFIKNGKLDL